MNSTDTTRPPSTAFARGDRSCGHAGHRGEAESRANGRADAHGPRRFFPLGLRGCSAGSAASDLTLAYRRGCFVLPGADHCFGRGRGSAVLPIFRETRRPTRRTLPAAGSGDPGLRGPGDEHPFCVVSSRPRDSEHLPVRHGCVFHGPRSGTRSRHQVLDPGLGLGGVPSFRPGAHLCRYRHTGVLEHPGSFPGRLQPRAPAARDRTHASPESGSNSASFPSICGYRTYTRAPRRQWRLSSRPHPRPRWWRCCCDI